VDILRRTESGYEIYEVKNSRELHEQFVKDAAFQLYLTQRCGLKIGHVFLVLHGEDEDNPFELHDITAQARGYVKWINDHIWDLNKKKKQREEVMVEPGPQCTEPYECWYCAYCTALAQEKELT